MPIDGEYEPSPWDIIADQVRLYESSGGTEGTLLEGKPCAKTGREYRPNPRLERVE